MITLAQLNAVLKNISREQMRYCALEFRKASSRHQNHQANRWLKFAIYHRAASLQGLKGNRMPQDICKVADDIMKAAAASL